MNDDDAAWLYHFREVAKRYPDGSAKRAVLDEYVDLYPKLPDLVITE